MVEVILEDGFAAVAAVHDVVDRAGVLHSQLAGHAHRFSKLDRRRQAGKL